MPKPKLVRVTTVPLSLEKLLENQLAFMQEYYDVTAISSDKDRLEKFGKSQGVETFHLDLTRKITPLHDLRTLYYLYRFLSKEKPKIVHTHTPKAGIVGMLAAYLAGVPSRLHTVAGLPLMEAKGAKRWLLKTVEKWTYRLATHVFPNSMGLQDFIISEKLAIQSKLKVLGNGSSNGIDTAYFNPSLYDDDFKQKERASLGITDTDFVFVFVGRLVNDKGINELVHAFESLSRKNDSVSLLLVGPFEPDLDPLKQNTLQIIEAHPKIYTTGYQVDVRAYFAISNALAFPSYREGFPNVVMQAGAMGLPSIVSDINGCNEIITHGVNGLVIPVKNQLALQEAMQTMLLDSNQIENMGAVSKQYINNHFDQEQFWNVLLKLYQQL